MEPKLSMFGMPISDPINLTTNNPRTETVIPIIPDVIFFFADSIDPLSPPEVIIPTAPVIKINTNHIIPITVISPIAEEIKVEKIEGALVFGPAKPKVPKPLYPFGSLNKLICAIFIMVLVWLVLTKIGDH